MWFLFIIQKEFKVFDIQKIQIILFCSILFIYFPHPRVIFWQIVIDSTF